MGLLHFAKPTNIFPGPVIEILQKQGAMLGYDDASTQLCTAAESGDMRQMTRLIDNGVDPNVPDYDRRTAFHVAASNGTLKVVEYLLACNANANAIDSRGQTPLHVAVLGGHQLVAKLIRAKGGRLFMDKAAQAQVII